MSYHGECIICHKDVENGHGRMGPFTFCPACHAREGCARCQTHQAQLAQLQPPRPLDLIEPSFVSTPAMYPARKPE